LATIREYFDTDFAQYLGIHREMHLSVRSTSVNVTARLLVGLDANVKFGAYFVPTNRETFEVCRGLVQHPEWVLDLADGVDIQGGISTVGTPNIVRPFALSETQFSRRIFLYCETPLSESEVDTCINEGQQRGLSIHYRT
jgi:hypothetical protein